MGFGARTRSRVASWRRAGSAGFWAAVDERGCEVTGGTTGALREMVRRITCEAKGHDNVRHQCCGAIKTTYTTYSYRLSDGVNRWEIQKRFSDFDTLDRELQNRYPKRMLKIDKIPRKSKFHAMAPRHIEAREKGFDTYLRQLLRDGELLQSPELTEFLEIPREAALSEDDFDGDHEPATAKSDGSHGESELSQAATTPCSARVSSWQLEAEAKWGGDGRLSSVSLPLGRHHQLTSFSVPDVSAGL